MSVEWGVVCRPKQGQTISGDTYIIQEFGNNRLLVAVIDGLGGGTEAAHAADKAAEVLRNHPDRPLKNLLQQAHIALHNTRGAVIAIMHFDLQLRHIDFSGIGNIGAQVYSKQSIKPISKNGILGYRLPTLLQLTYAYDSGDTFVLYSDGISSRFTTHGNINIAQSPQAIADTIHDQYGKSIDDATVVVVRDTSI